MSAFKKRAPRFQCDGGKIYAVFTTLDGRDKKVRLSDDEATARAEHADLSRRFLTGDYEPPPLQRRRKSRTPKTADPAMPKTSPTPTPRTPGFVWPIPIRSGQAHLALPTIDLDPADLAVLRLSLKHFGEMIDLMANQAEG